MQKFLPLLLLLFFTLLVQAQEYTYDIFYKKNKIGQLEIDVSSGDIETTYKVVSNVKGPFNINFGYEMNCSYKDGILENSTCETFLNGKKRSYVNTKRKGAYYNVNIDGEKSKYNELINYSGALQYMNEPLNKHASIYSDMEGSIRVIENLGSNKYRFTNPEKKRNISVYQYENGILERAIYDYGLYTIMIQRK